MVVTYAEAKIGYLLTFGSMPAENMTYKEMAERTATKIGLAKYPEFLESAAVRTAIDDYIHARNDFALVRN